MSNYHKADYRKKEKVPSIPVHTVVELQEMTEKKRKRKEMMSGKVKR